MGFGFPAAMGAKVACPDREVIDIDGDGSFLMNVQELACAKVEGIAAKAIILNNQHLGMVVQWEDRFYKSNRGHTVLSDPKQPGVIYPDYVKICEGFGVKCERVTRKEDLRAAMERMLASEGSLRARRDDALHGARPADDPGGRDVQGHHHGVKRRRDKD